MNQYFNRKDFFDSKKMDVLYSDDAEAIRKYLSAAGGLRKINNRYGYNDTSLYCACYYNRNDVVDVLIQFEANVNESFGLTKETPLVISCKRGYIDIVIRLLQARADPNIPDEHGVTPIMNATRRGYLDIVILLTIYTNFNATTNFGDTIFTYAIFSQNNDMVDYIFDYCTDINHTNNKGWSYLHHAVFYKKKYTISLLLNKGIDIHIRSNSGRKAADLTRDPEILAFLRSFS